LIEEAGEVDASRFLHHPAEVVGRGEAVAMSLLYRRRSSTSFNEV
jgi:hypothetical protein